MDVGTSLPALTTIEGEFEMAAKELPPQDVLLQLFEYAPATGLLFWKKRDPEMFSDLPNGSIANANNWNAKWAGRQAFTSINSHGYFHGSIFYKLFLAHRVVWKMHTGEDADQIDHVNGVPNDNRINNLRNVSHQENHKNRSSQSNTSSGTVGVYRKNGKYAAHIKVNQKQIYLGIFDRYEDAVNARKSAEIEYGFHKNHGRPQ